MPESVPMIEGIVALIDALPHTAGGDAKVSDAYALAVDVIGVVAPVYQVDIDAFELQANTATSLADQLNAELTLLRNDVDQMRNVLARVKGHLDGDDIVSAKAVLDTIPS